MITLVTGLPGHGKTLFTLAEIHQEWIEKPKKKSEPLRPVYYLSKTAVDSPGSGIAGLTLDGWSEFTDPQSWWDLPNGSIIVIDECQYCLPRRSPGKEPEWIAQFAEHRKKGFDIYLITQDCRNMDYFVRRLAGQHIHYWRPMGAKAATRWEFPKAIDKPDDHFEQKNATSKKLVKHPKAFYSAYASANVHTVKTKIPIKLLLFPVALLVTGVLIYFGINKLTGKKPPIESSSTLGLPGLKSEKPELGQVTRQQVINWNAQGIKSVDLHLVPFSCSISKKIVKCPYESLPPQTLAVSKNTLCKIDEKGSKTNCYIYIPIIYPDAPSSDSESKSILPI